MLTRRFLLATTTLIVSAAPLAAQQGITAAPGASAAAVPVDAFSFEIGHATRAGTVYMVTATQPATSKLTGQKVRLKVVESAGADTTTRYFTLATGKHKTVAELDTILTGIFRKFLNNPSPAPELEVGKIGDVQLGGEVRFVAAAPDVLRFDNVAPDEPVHGSNYSRVDIESLLAALTGNPSA